MAIYFKARSPDVAMFRGFDIFWIQLIPVLMACSGISISFVLKYFDNIVKLLCSSIAVLLVHAVTTFMTGGDLLDVCFICGWLLTMPAAYLYYVTPPPAVRPSQLQTQIQQGPSTGGGDDDSIEKKGHHNASLLSKFHANVDADKHDVTKSTSTSINRTSLRITAVVAILLVVSVYNSSFNLPSSAHMTSGASQSSSSLHIGAGDGTVSFSASCPLHEVCCH
jgi:hypothetical protein